MIRPDHQKLQNLLQPARSIAILLPKNPSYDSVAAALALKISLDASGKSATVSCPDPLTVEFHRLVGASSITSNFGSRNLVISFPDQTESVDKVSYNLDDHGILQLIVTPKPGSAGLDHRRLKFVSGGAQADLVILVGVADLSDLGQIYIDSKDLLAQVPQFQVSGSEEVTHLLTSLSLPVSADAASNLFTGLQKITRNFQAESVTADTFEAAAILMRHGAHHIDVASPSDFPEGSIPTPPPNADQPPTRDWYAPKVYKGTTVS